MAIDNSQWGLTPAGFYVPSYQEVLSSYEDDFIRAYGENIPLTTNSQFGILAHLFARREKSLREQQQLTYYSAFITYADGASLDYIGGNLGLKRKVDSPSFAQIVITTEEEYLIQAGEQFETEDGYEFTLLKDVLTTQHSDGSWSGTGWVQSEETGKDTNVSANSITVETNPDEEVVSVTNPEPAGGGQDYEDDETYRERLRMENAARPGSTNAGIRSALMNLDGVRQVHIVENPDETADKYGNAPESVHIYVLGGSKQNIAETLADYIAAGARLNGSVDVMVNDATGYPREIKFDFATEKPIYAHVTINVNDAWNIDDGVADVKQSIADYINSLEMSDPLYITKLYPCVYDIEGISEADIQIGLAADQLSDSNIINKDYEVPTCDINNIEVTVNGL